MRSRSRPPKPSMSDREQLKEHLVFASELGVAGVSRDPSWRMRQETPGARETANADPPLDASATVSDAAVSSAAVPDTAVPVVVVRNAAEVLAAIKEDIGPACSRCKLH